MVVCWLIVVFNLVFYAYLLFSYGQYNDLSLKFLVNTFHLSKLHVSIIKVSFVIHEVQYLAIWTFTQAMNHKLLPYFIVYYRIVMTSFILFVRLYRAN